MKQLALIALVIVGMLMVIAPAAAQNAATGMSVTCDNGVSFDNGVEVRVVQMRSGFSYVATAIGINGFDPVLAVLNEDGNGLCVDDSQDAAAYTISLPSTGTVEPSNLNSQISFSNNTNSALADISLVVGGVNNMSGEFVLLLENMVVTDGDGVGDPFSVRITDDMIASGVPLTAYMISVTNGLDSMIGLIDSEYNFLQDNDGNYLACDDAGNSELCWGESVGLSDYYVSRSNGRALGGGPYDAMLLIPLSEDLSGFFVNYAMRSSGGRTFGDYVVAFHMGVGETDSKGLDLDVDEDA